jgi:hypothetical protein
LRRHEEFLSETAPDALRDSLSRSASPHGKWSSAFPAEPYKQRWSRPRKIPQQPW